LRSVNTRGVVAGDSKLEADPRCDHARAILVDRGITTRLRRVAAIDAAALRRELTAETPGLIVLCGSAWALEAVHTALEPLASALLLLPASAQTVAPATRRSLP
jgi:small ligand-binding sensory domain FIST